MAAQRDYVAIGRRYAEQVVAGEIAACEWVRLACQRQLDDLKREWEWDWDPEVAARICLFAEQLPHVKGKWDTTTIVLQPWQCFFLTTLFGWVHKETQPNNVVRKKIGRAHL